MSYKRMAINVDWTVSYCFEVADKTGILKCDHLTHQKESESEDQFIKRVNEGSESINKEKAKREAIEPLILTPRDERHFEVNTGVPGDSYEASVKMSAEIKSMILESDIMKKTIKINGLDFKIGVEETINEIAIFAPDSFHKIGNKLGLSVICKVEGIREKTTITTNDGSVFNMGKRGNGIFKDIRLCRSLYTDKSLDPDKVFNWASKKINADIEIVIVEPGWH